MNTVTANHIIPIKVFNPSDDTIHLTKGSVLADFAVLNENDTILSNVDGDKMTCNHITVKSNDDVDQNQFYSHFDTQDKCTLDKTQKGLLDQCLYKNKDIFVTPDNRQLGFSKLAEHKIHTIPNAVSKHQRPYRVRIGYKPKIVYYVH